MKLPYPIGNILKAAQPHINLDSAAPRAQRRGFGKLGLKQTVLRVSAASQVMYSLGPIGEIMIVYIDMDDVLCDFQTAYDNDLKESIRKLTNFISELKRKHGGDTNRDVDNVQRRKQPPELRCRSTEQTGRPAGR